MGTVQLVTDSTASFDSPRFAEEHGITVLPMQVQIGDKRFRSGIDIDSEEVLHQMRHNNAAPRVTAPSIQDFEAIYRDLNRTSDSVCVMLSSQHLTEAYANAQSARSSVLGRCEIVVVDSQSVGMGLGFLVEQVVEAAQKDMTFEEVVRFARSIVPRLYSVFYVSDLSYIQRAGLIGQSQAMLGTMLGIKPLVTIEDGAMITMEKARTHTQALDKLMEFVTEFTDIDRLRLLNNTLRPTDHSRMLFDRLMLEFGTDDFPLSLYEPLTASLLGPDALGIALLEGASTE
ncbi:MAG: DegV family protein [Anaerolineae bacterium]|nr:DegV family protein [Anaerolineae bacterium]